VAPYTVLRKFGDGIEVRRYGPQVCVLLFLVCRIPLSLSPFSPLAGVCAGLSS